MYSVVAQREQLIIVSHADLFIRVLGLRLGRLGIKVGRGGRSRLWCLRVQVCNRAGAAGDVTRRRKQGLTVKAEEKESVGEAHGEGCIVEGAWWYEV